MRSNNGELWLIRWIEICDRINDEMKNEWEIICFGVDFKVIKIDFEIRFNESDCFFNVADEIINGEIVLFLFFVLLKRCFNVWLYVDLRIKIEKREFFDVVKFIGKITGVFIVVDLNWKTINLFSSKIEISKIKISIDIEILFSFDVENLTFFVIVSILFNSTIGCSHDVVVNEQRFSISSEFWFSFNCCREFWTNEHFGDWREWTI